MKFIKNIVEKLQRKASQCALALANNKGGPGETETVVLIIAAIVIGAVLIGLVLVLFKDSLWPLVTKALQDLFNLS